MVELLGLIVLMAVVGIGLLDIRSGLGPFDVYRSADGAGMRRPTPTTGHRGDDTQPRPPSSTR